MLPGSSICIRAHRLMPDLFEMPVQTRLRARFVQPNFRPAQNRSNPVVEVVRDSPGQLPDRFEFLSLP
jgi:hypothetical protein